MIRVRPSCNLTHLAFVDLLAIWAFRHSTHMWYTKGSRFFKSKQYKHTYRVASYSLPFVGVHFRWDTKGCSIFRWKSSQNMDLFQGLRLIEGLLDQAKAVLRIRFILDGTTYDQDMSYCHLTHLTFIVHLGGMGLKAHL